MRVSDLCYDESVVLPPRHSAYTTTRQQDPSDGGLKSNKKLHFSEMCQEMPHQNLR
jgi:hypothetical protein